MPKKSGIPSRGKRSLASNNHETSSPYSKPNRLKKQERKLITQNKRYFFYFKDGQVHYELKKEFKDE